ncbi:hypothetical protein [Deinococcus planocerae]|uniref:hypothetical protein n=1 Tax=Deinococcus planocerae TaxID=1737569 RepID=UPI000C7EA05D|nr:hypothetical protein [Deinococcus planocerae]
MTDDGAAATGGMRGITEDTPDHAGAPGEAGSVDGVSAFGGEPEVGEAEGFIAPDDPPQATDAVTADRQGEREEGLVSGLGGGVTGTDDL